MQTQHIDFNKLSSLLQTDNAAATSSVDAPANLSGNLDLYSMNLPFLKKVYLPESGSKPQYEKLYHEILTFQKEKDWSGQMYLPKPNSLERGQFQCHEDMPFKIAFDNVEFSENLTFSANEKKKLFWALRLADPVSLAI